MPIYLWMWLHANVSIPIWCDWKSSFLLSNFSFAEFQFQSGAIERIQAQLQLLSSSQGFNSNLVRLKARSLWLCQAPKLRFNSNLVRLKAELMHKSQNQILVSIPIWCDWKEEFHAVWGSTQFVSIPIWCDWKLRVRTLTCRLQYLFQFQSGAIERIFGGRRRFSEVGFQFQSGAIESLLLPMTLRRTQRFNSNLVRLKGSNCSIENPCIAAVSIPIWCDWKSLLRPISTCRPRFNSNLVRLKVFKNWRRSRQNPAFQFQSGAIERLITNSPDVDKLGFNSNLVRLKGEERRNKRKVWQSFNSNLVRLKVYYVRKYIQHYSGFNSNLVRLKVIVRALPARAYFEFQFQSGAIESLPAC